MERKWLALANDPLPLRLGQKVVPLKGIVPAEIHAKIAAESPVKWSKDGPYMGSDYAHPVAPDCRNKTKAKVERAVDCGFDDLIDAMFGLDKIVPLWEGAAISRAEAERAMVRFVQLLDFDAQTKLIGAAVSHRTPGEKYNYRSKCTCDDCRVVRLMVKRERAEPLKDRVTVTKQIMDEIYARNTSAQYVGVDLATKPDEPATMLLYTYLDSAGRQHSTASPATDEEVKAHYKDRALGQNVLWGAPKTATGLQMLMDAEERERRRRGNCCPGCGVNEGAKHFLSCWVGRPELLG